MANTDHTRDVVKGLDAGADHCLTKPCDDQVLLARIAEIMARPAKVPAAPPAEPLEFEYGGATHVITAGRREILGFFMATYENAVHHLRRTQANLQAPPSPKPTLMSREIETMAKDWHRRPARL